MKRRKEETWIAFHAKMVASLVAIYAMWFAVASYQNKDLLAIMIVNAFVYGIIYVWAMNRKAAQRTDADAADQCQGG
jgi:type IV secretory pathway TrbL component